MSFPPYEKYKPSGVEWLGDVPEHWVVTALKRGFEVTLGKMLQPESKSPEDVLKHYLRAANIQWAGVDTSSIKRMWMSERERAQLCLENGDLLVSEGGDVGRSCLWAGEVEECYFQNSVNRVRARDGHSNGYLRYWMSTIKNKGYIDVLCNKSTIAHFTAEKVASVPVPFPPLAEQAAIAAFLDLETAKIDGLVAEQRRLMELLKEKRQSVISHAVTKGVNPAAPMKPTGIEWLGDVPAHWKVTPIKYLAKVGNGSTPNREMAEYWGENGFPWLNSSVVNQIFVSEAEGFVTERALKECHLPIVHPPAVLVGITGQGRTRGMASMLVIEATINQHVAFVKPISPNLETDFLFRTLQSAYFKLRRDSEEVGATKGAITCTQIGNLPIPFPPLAEQQNIATYLETELSKIDTLTTEAQRAIALLQERRTALISAAVTGQIDVRNL